MARALRLDLRSLTGAVLAGWLAVGLLSEAHSSTTTSEVRIALSLLSPKSGNPYQGGTLPAVALQQAVFDRLVRLDSNGRPSPGLALSWSTTDSKTWIFHLRPEVVFTDGEPFTAAALVESVEHMQSPSGRSETVGSYFTNVNRVTIVDDLTAQIELQQPDVIFPIHASVWFVPAPKAWKTLGTDAFSMHPVGSGPFKLESFGPARAVLVKNDLSWHPPSVDRIILLAIKEESSRESALLANQVDLAMSISAESKDSMEQAGKTLWVRSSPLIQYTVFNLLDRPTSPLQDTRVRQALNMAVNREALTKAFYFGKTQPTGQLAAATSFGFDSTIKPYPFDPARAKALLNEAGYPHGFSVTIELSAVTSDMTQVYQVIANDLSHVGIAVTLRPVPLLVLTTDMLGGHMPAEMFASGVRSLDPLLDYRFRTCLQVIPGRRPFSCNPKVLDIVRRARAEDNLEKTEALYREALRQEFADPPGIFLWESVDFDGVSPALHHYAPHLDFINFDELTSSNH